MLDFEYSQIKGAICDILHLIKGLQIAYLQHKNTILAKVFKYNFQIQEHLGNHINPASPP